MVTRGPGGLACSALTHTPHTGTTEGMRAFSTWTQNTHPPPAGKVTIHPPSISQRMKLRLSKVTLDILRSCSRDSNLKAPGP